MSGRAADEPPVRWRALAFLLFSSGIASIAAGVLLTAPALLFLGLPLLFGPIAATLYGPRSVPRARLEWRSEGTGATVDILGRFVPEPPTRTADLDLECSLPSGLSERAPPRIERTPEEIRFALSGRAPHPLVVPVPPPRLAWSDPAGLVARPVHGPSPPLVVERYPPELWHLGAVRLERTIPWPGETPSRRLGASGEFAGIREARPTDPARRINWRASARAGRLLANEYELDRTGDVLLLLDARPTPLGRALDTHLLALSVAAAEGIAQSFLREKARVGLGVFGEFLDAVPLAGGRRQALRIRQTLVRARVAEVAGIPERCAVSLGRQFPPGVTTVLFSSLAVEDADALVAHLGRRGFPALVLSPSPLPLQDGTGTASRPDAELVRRLARLERRERLARIWAFAPVVDWEEFWSLSGLVALLRRPVRRGRPR
ncbi:MAG TPA: DUF58 domain-containing protein [Thermoplasmata archaeon]|nr:DUF58 domain-containing protein [Thermoplasmata archaeon]